MAILGKPNSVILQTERIFSFMLESAPFMDGFKYLHVFLIVSFDLCQESNFFFFFVISERFSVSEYHCLFQFVFKL